jgi:hypothetical protein
MILCTGNCMIVYANITKKHSNWTLVYRPHHIYPSQCRHKHHVRFRRKQAHILQTTHLQATASGHPCLSSRLQSFEPSTETDLEKVMPTDENWEREIQRRSQYLSLMIVYGLWALPGCFQPTCQQQHGIRWIVKGYLSHTNVWRERQILNVQ